MRTVETQIWKSHTPDSPHWKILVSTTDPRVAELFQDLGEEGVKFEDEQDLFCTGNRDDDPAWNFILDDAEILIHWKDNSVLLAKE